MKKIGVFLVILISTVLAGCFSGEISMKGDFYAECPECDENIGEGAVYQCQSPCMDFCLEKDMGVTTFEKVRVKGEMLCTCNCDSDAQNELLIAKAIKSQEIEICDKILDSYFKGTCYILVAEAKKDESICETIELKQGVNSQDHCYINVATGKADKELCNKVITVSGENSKDVCLVQVAQKTGDVSICEDIIEETGLSSKEACYALVAIETGDAGLCDKITQISGFNSRDACYLLVANKIGDLSLCENIVVETGPTNSKEVCYVLYAIKIKDKSLCDKAISPEIKNHCLEQIG